MSALSGSCLCERVSYHFTGTALSSGICYCRQCQKTGGAFGSPLLVVRRADLALSSPSLPHHVVRPESGGVVHRYFCPDCGSAVYAVLPDHPEIATIRAATLHEFHHFRAQYLCWLEEAPECCAIPPGVPAFAGEAPLALVLGAAPAS